MTDIVRSYEIAMSVRTSSSSAKPSALAAVSTAGLVAGALDILYAFVLAALQDGGTPMPVLHAIASGALGISAYQGGAGTAALGFIFHFGIAIVAALVYFLIARSVAVLRTHDLLCGAVFGVLVYLFMNFVVLPLSAVPFKIEYTPQLLLQGFVSHAILVGIPIAFVLRRLYFVRDGGAA